MITDRRQRADARFLTLLASWLASLPPDGWEGTSHELGEALAGFAERRRVVAFVPLCPGPKVASLAGFLTAHGFTLTHHRTKHVRTLRVTRASPGPDSRTGALPVDETVGA